MKIGKNILAINSVLLIIVISFIIIEQTGTIFTLLYTIILFIIFSLIVDPKHEFYNKNSIVFMAYLVLAILMYVVHKIALPEYYGFSGPLGIGTDDLGFFYNASENLAYKPPAGYRIFDHLHNFSRFLRVLYPFKISHPLNLIIPNVLGITFIPLYSYRISVLLTNDQKIAKLAFVLTSICPIIISNGLILVRDGWITFFFMTGLFSILSRRYIPLIISLFLTGFLRLSSGLLLLLCVIFYLGYITRNVAKGKAVSFVNYLSLIIVGGIILVLMFSRLQNYLESKGIEGLNRQTYIEGFLVTFKDSLFYRIQNLPVFLSIPVSYIFFFFAPFLKFQFFTLGVFNFRSVLNSVVFPLIFIFYVKYLFQGIIYSIGTKDKQIRNIVYLTLLLVFMLSHFSLQFRHKTTIMPLYYIIISYGFYNHNMISRQIGGISLIVLLFVQIIYLML